MDIPVSRGGGFSSATGRPGGSKEVIRNVKQDEM